MKNSDLIDFLRSKGLDPTAQSETTHLMLTGKMIRCVDGDTLIAAAGSDLSKNNQINAVVDAVHWHIQIKGETGRLQIMIGRRKDAASMAEVLNAIAILIENLKIPLTVNVTVDLQDQQLTAKPYRTARNWIESITRSGNKIPPKIALELSDKVGNSSFRWYRAVTANSWSGRVDGLQVCEVSADGKAAILDVGKPGKNGKIGFPRQVFLEIADGKEGPFDESRLHEVSEVIKKLSASRESGRLSRTQREHMLESLVLRKEVTISSENGILSPVCDTYPFQFPTLWSPNGPARFIDALMHVDGIPYVVELKEPKGSSPGQGYRHAITQAVLYREFIRGAIELHPWFFERKLDPLQCRAAIAFPRMGPQPKHQMILKQHKAVARAFGVEVIEID